MFGEVSGFLYEGKGKVGRVRGLIGWVGGAACIGLIILLLLYVIVCIYGLGNMGMFLWRNGLE